MAKNQLSRVSGKSSCIDHFKVKNSDLNPNNIVSAILKMNVTDHNAVTLHIDIQAKNDNFLPYT